MLYIYLFTSEHRSQTTSSSEGDSQGQERFLAPSADTCNYDKECSNHHPFLSTPKVKGIYIRNLQISQQMS